MVSESELQRDLHAAMRAREMLKVYTLRGIIAAIKNLRVEKQVPELTETDVIALVRKELKKRVETIGYAEKAGRQDTVEQNQAEKAIIETYLPPQLGAADLEKVIADMAAELGTTQIGPLMAALRQRCASQFDGKLASEIIRKLPK